TTSTKVISQLAVRRDGLFSANTTTAHAKQIRIRMSTTTQPVHAPNMTTFDHNHGSNVTDVLGSQGNPATVVFPPTPAPATGLTAPFNVIFKLDRPFFVRNNTEALAIELRTYSATVAAGEFNVDSVRFPGTNYNGGVFTLIYPTHCISPTTLYTARDRYIGGALTHIWRTRAGAGKLMVGWLGTKFPTGIKIPGTGDTTLNIPQCELWVNTDIFVTATLTAPGPESVAYFNWGPIPNDQALIGAMISHQACRIDPTANAAGLGFTRAADFTIGTGYDPLLVEASSVYSYGDVNTVSQSGINMHPDTEVHPRYFYRRAVIFEVQ
ncbi:MAG TPA: hypothetical protein PKE00_04980, partial [Planctomycetota bacterium]|nr:hypothetical protein [Planctomycetota bacterium]